MYKPLYKWAKRRRMVRRNPLADFELPKSDYVPQPRLVPEVEQVCWLLAAAFEFVPDIAPVLTMIATTGMRRGEAPVRRRNDLNRRRKQLRVDTAADVDGIKPTKTDKVRDVDLDDETVEMLLHHIGQMDERASQCGVEVVPDAFIFSLEPDCSKPMPADYVTKQLAKLKEYLGIANKRPETIRLENEALRLRREPVEQPKAKPGPAPTEEGMSYDEIGRRLGRTQTWARKAVKSAQQREAVQLLEEIEQFDASLIGMRKFTSSELLDAGFNIAVAADRQGHDPQVLAKYYARARRSAQRKAAEHLGRLIHRQTEGSEINASSL